jgi:hypothetical protein
LAQPSSIPRPWGQFLKDCLNGQSEIPQRFFFLNIFWGSAVSWQTRLANASTKKCPTQTFGEPLLKVTYFVTIRV